LQLTYKDKTSLSELSLIYSLSAPYIWLLTSCSHIL